MNNELQVVNPTQFGIEETQATELLGNLPQIKSERAALEEQYNEIIKLDIEDKETSKSARALRLMIRENRTKGIDVWHKTTKDFFLKGGQFVDSIKRMEVAVNQRMEESLEQIEKHFEIQEAKRKETLKTERISELELYQEFVPMGISFGEISDEEYAKVKNGAKLQYEAKIEAERKAEEERIEAEKVAAELAETERIEKEKAIEAQRLENERLKKEAEAREIEIKKELEKAEAERKAIEDKAKKEREKADKAAKLEVEKQAKIQAEKEAQAKKEREEADKAAKLEAAKQSKIQAEKDAEIKKQREAKEKLEAELKAKKDAEEKAVLEAKKEAEKLAKAPIKNQLSVWVNSFDIPATNVDNEVSKEIKGKFEAFKKWSITQIENL